MESKGGLFEILAKIKARPGMYIGHPSLSDLFVFLAGYKTARRELGIKPTDRELEFYDNFHEFVQNHYQIHSSNSWAKIISFYCLEESQSFDRFFELLAEFETRSKNLQQPQNNLIVV
jgi:hypothetical protein